MNKEANLTLIKNNTLNNLDLNFNSDKYKTFDFERIKEIFINDQMIFQSSIFNLFKSYQSNLTKKAKI